MKRFEFPLRALYDVKSTQKEEKQGEYLTAQAVQEQFAARKEELTRILAVERKKCTERMCQGVTTRELQVYGAFLEEQQKQLEYTCVELSRAQQVTELRRGELVSLHKELKMLDKLRDEQYRTYLVEVHKKEANAIEDVLAFDLLKAGTEVSGKMG